jgi:hypothetical protein
MYRGNGRAASCTGTGEAVGSGWGGFTALLAPATSAATARCDILARRSDGRLLLYRGNGDSGFAGGAVKIGSGWGGFTALLAPGDWNGDGKADVLARAADAEAAALPRERGGRLGDRPTRADRHRAGRASRRSRPAATSAATATPTSRPRVRRLAPALQGQRRRPVHLSLPEGRIRLASLSFLTLVASPTHRHPPPPPAPGDARADPRRPRDDQRRRPLHAARRARARHAQDPQAQGPQEAAQS